MDFYLHHRGQNLGVFPLEELRRRRAAGELSEADLVWRLGMEAWVPLDSVLGEGGSGALGKAQPPPIPVKGPKRKSRLLVWGIAVAAVLVVTSVATVGFFAVRFAQRVRQAVRAAGGNKSVESVKAASKPITVSSNSLTETAVRKRGREFRVRQYAEGYRKNGQHAAAWDHDASQLIESWIAAHYGGPTNLPSPQALGDKLVKQPGCDDPLVLSVAAATAIERHEKIRRLERALAGFDHSRYQAYPKLHATIMLATELGSRSSRIGSLDQGALQCLTEALKDGSFRPEDEEEIAEILVNGWARNFFGRNGVAVCQTVREAKGYPWLTLALEGEWEVAEAWKVRGSGWAKNVTSEGWQGFSEHLSKARAALTQAWKLQPHRPLAPARMITVAMADSGAEEMRTWFERAVEAQLDYGTAWSSMRWGLRPRWHGSHEAMLALGVRAVETQRFDTDVPRKYFDSISDVESELELPPGEHIYGRSDIWSHLKQMYEGYLAEPSRQQQQDGWRSSYAAAAYLAGQYQVAREQLEALHWKPVRENLTGWGTDLSLMSLKVAALTGKSADRVRRAESKYSHGDLAAPLKLYAELSSSPAEDDRTREFSRCRLASLKQEERLAKGEWIDFLPTDGKDPGWEFANSKVRRLPDGALEVESGPQGHGFYARTRVGPGFEVTGDFELVRSSTPDFQAGLIMGLLDGPKSSEWYAFRMKSNTTEGKVASFSQGWTTQQVTRKIALSQSTNSFRFCLRDGKADAWMNGTRVLHQAAPAKTLRLHSDCMLGLGAYGDMNETVIRYRNIKVRRLQQGE